LTTGVTGYTDSANLDTNSNIDAVNNPFTCTSTTVYLGNAGAATDAQAFNANASGCIRQGAAQFDTWSINDTKILSNVRLGL
jgi:hypothetical protein